MKSANKPKIQKLYWYASTLTEIIPNQNIDDIKRGRKILRDKNLEYRFNQQARRITDLRNMIRREYHDKAKTRVSSI